MSKTYIIVNACTAFVIAAGTAIGVVMVGGRPTGMQIGAAVVAGLVVAAKDTRSLLKMPAVDSPDKPAGS